MAARVDTDVVHVFRVNDAGMAEVGTPISTGSDPAQVEFHPTADVVYVPNASSGNISIFAFDEATGTLTPDGPPVPLSGDPGKVVIDPSGRFFYALELDDAGGNDRIVTFMLDPSGALVLVDPPIDAAIGSVDLAITRR